MSATRDAAPPLSRDDWKQLEPLLDALLDAPSDQRTALLAELSGGDPGRRRALEQLLHESERTSTLLDRPATDRFGSLLIGGAASVPETLADRYHIERELGRGGMATVYLAQDLRHHRNVAVKVLRPELAAALGRERFLREIAIAASCSTPTSCRSTIRARPTASSTTSCRSWRETRCGTARARWRAAGPRGGEASSPRWPTRSPTRTRRASSTATSSRTTCCSPDGTRW